MISPGGGCALPGLQPQITAGAGVAETADAGGLNIAETFPELALGSLKLPMLAASTSLRRSRKAGAA
ncbi:hypothetical protein, partial [Klebsiella pneumoniae]|uniref:hypothetical protein n=1 Tax=Klebsiella pneumoniae TaxID=573 RepID=UPI001A8F6094